MADPLDFDRIAPPIYGLKKGVVLDNADPLQLGRVRVTIDVIAEEGTGWAFPLGTLGGGEKDRGFFSVPPIGAEVGVLFEHGDIDAPNYLCGHYGRPRGVSDVPESARDKGESETPKVHVFQTEEFELVFDDRTSAKAFRAKHIATGSEVAIDGLTGSITINAQANVTIEATGTIDINGLVVNINGVPAGSGML